MTGIIKVDTIQSNGGTTGLTIDSTGRVSALKNPAFYAHTFSGTDGTRTNGTASTAAFTYSNVITNDGSHWNNTTGEFTCPVAGRYFVSGTFNRRADSTTWYGATIEHNTTRVQQSWEPPANPADTNFVYTNMTLTCIIDAAVNDTIAPVYFTSYSDPGTGGFENAFTVMYLG